MVERYEYDPYGRTYIASGDSTVRRAVSMYGNPFAWTGQRYDAGVKLYGFFARAYSPELGRWLQRDPLGFVDGVNLYEYVQSAPTVLTDPLGLLSLFPGFSDGSDAGGGGGGGGSGAGDPPPYTDPCGGFGFPWDEWLVEPIEAFGGRLSGSPPPPPPPPPTEPPVLWLDPGVRREDLVYSMVNKLQKKLIGWLGGGTVDDEGVKYFWKEFNEQTRGARQVAMVAGLGIAAVASGVCFTEDTPVLTDTGPVPIQNLCVGDRVLTTEDMVLPPLAPEETGPVATTDIDPADYVVVTLEMPNPDGSADVIDLECLCSRDWVIAHGVERGAWIPFEISELDLRGPAFVVSVEPCPPLQAGRGHLVVTTLTHLNSAVLRIGLVGQESPFEPTSEHRLFSEDRSDWVPAGELRVGERLRTLQGPLAIERIEHKPGTHRVYNVQVAGDEHCYFVSSAGVLSHNLAGCMLLIGYIGVGVKLHQVATDALVDAGCNPDAVEVGLDAVAIGLTWGLGPRGLKGGRDAPAPRWKYDVKTRPTPGRSDGGESIHIIEYLDGRTNSVTHQVTANGKIVHQHQRYIGKYGSKTEFPDEWGRYPRVPK